MSASRAIREFPASPDMWNTVDAWAKRQGFRVIAQDASRRIYKKGHGIAAGSRMIDLSQTGEQAHLEAWVAANGLARAFSLFILPPEITIESNGVKAVLPRKLGRDEVNDLLAALGQQPIG